MVKKYKINYKSIGGTSSTSSTSSTKNDNSLVKNSFLTFPTSSTSSTNNDDSLVDGLTLNFLWISCNYTPLSGTECIYCNSYHDNSNPNKIIEKFNQILERWEELNNVFINLWYHSDYDEVNIQDLIDHNRVKIFDLKFNGYKLDEINSYSYENENPFSDKKDILDKKFKKDLEYSNKESTTFFNNLAKSPTFASYKNDDYNFTVDQTIESSKNNDYYLTPFYLKIDYSKHVIMAAQYNKTVCKTRYSCVLDIDVPTIDILKYDENEKKYNNKEAIEKLDFFGIILGKSFHEFNEFENGFIMIDTTKLIVHDALKYSCELLEELVKMEEFKNIKLSKDKQQAVYQKYSYFFEYLLLCLINDEKKLNLDIENYKYQIEIKSNESNYDYFKKNENMKSLLKNLKKNNLKTNNPDQMELEKNNLKTNNPDQMELEKDNLKTNNSDQMELEKNNLKILLQEKINEMNFLGFKYSILDLIQYIYNDILNDLENFYYQKTELLLSYLYFEEEEKFKEDKNIIIDNNNNISDDYINHIINNLDDYSKIFYESINNNNNKIRRILLNDLYYLDLSNEVNFIKYNKDNIIIYVPIIDVNLPPSQFD